jgi:hypothetical protein
VPATPEGAPTDPPALAPSPSAVPKDGCAPGCRTHPRPFRVFQAAAPAQTGAGAGELYTCSVSRAIYVVADVVEGGHSASFPTRSTDLAEKSASPRIGLPSTFVFGVPAAVLDRSVFTADLQGFPVHTAHTAGRFGRFHQPRYDPGWGTGVPQAIRHRCRPAANGRLPDGSRHPSACHSIRRSAEASRLYHPATPFRVLSPSSRSRPPLSLRPGRSPASVEGRSPPSPFGPGGAGDSSRLSGRVSVPL